MFRLGPKSIFETNKYMASSGTVQTITQSAMPRYFLAIFGLALGSMSSWIK